MRNIIKTVIFTIFVPGTVGGYIPFLLGGIRHARAASPIAWLGLAPAALGAVIYLWCAWDFATFGRGTPLPLDAPKQLVARGLYRYVRNPMYVGILLVILGQAWYFESTKILWYAAAVACAFNLFVILYEEPALRRQFGESYVQYSNTVPRWIPRPAATRARAK